MYFFKIPTINKLLLYKGALFLTVIFIFTYWQVSAQQTSDLEAQEVISNPKINDIYFLDFRLIKKDLRPKEKYRIAKVVDITGDVITLLYSSFYYPSHHSAKEAIKYGQLRYQQYFETKRYDFTLTELKGMLDLEIVALAKRPIHKMLFSNYIEPISFDSGSNVFIPGKSQNIAGEGFLASFSDESNLLSAFDNFSRSAELGYVEGQVNLAQMYINGQHVNKDLKQALYWLKQASFKSYKPAILKYVIVCKQVESCTLVDFYDELYAAGVNIEVKNVEFELGS